MLKNSGGKQHKKLTLIPSNPNQQKSEHSLLFLCSRNIIQKSYSTLVRSPPACRRAEASGWRRNRPSQRRAGCRGQWRVRWAECLWEPGPCRGTSESDKVCSLNRRWIPGPDWLETSVEDRENSIMGRKDTSNTPGIWYLNLSASLKEIKSSYKLFLYPICQRVL